MLLKQGTQKLDSRFESSKTRSLFNSNRELKKFELANKGCSQLSLLLDSLAIRAYLLWIY